jgi:hypothetical protein
LFESLQEDTIYISQKYPKIDYNPMIFESWRIKTPNPVIGMAGFGI